MMAGRSASLRFILLSICVLVVSADQRIFTRHTGTNVTLEFPVPTDTTAIWLKRPGSDKYIFRNGHPTRLEHQEESFKGRVEGTDCDKINGTVTITLSNLISSDNGTYEFQGMDSDGRRFNETIFLNVTDPGTTGGHTTEDGVNAALCLCHFWWCKKTWRSFSSSRIIHPYMLSQEGLCGENTRRQDIMRTEL
ncbi:butyrophilin subfamily 2 member A1-like [Archocentrus centrarchus]|uniref:butyrophilin subfamily 2 member A1-like n=1 Tax=Archocentrus centrarchus TaxID=63155 RepID=UPI0011EA32C2|nr:butyrophilin subfamily 2 member A1-like [Archocentrus centrarchus]